MARRRTASSCCRRSRLRQACRCVARATCRLLAAQKLPGAASVRAWLCCPLLFCICSSKCEAARSTLRLCWSTRFPRRCSPPSRWPPAAAGGCQRCTQECSRTRGLCRRRSLRRCKVLRAGRALEPRVPAPQRAFLMLATAVPSDSVQAVFATLMHWGTTAQAGAGSPSRRRLSRSMRARRACRAARPAKLACRPARHTLRCASLLETRLPAQSWDLCDRKLH